MSIFNRILQKISDRKARKQEEAYRLQQLRNEQAELGKIEFEKQRRIQLRDNAINMARQEVALKSGMAKLRAENRLRYLEENPFNFSENKMDKFKEYRLRNLQRTANNKERYIEMKNRIKTQKILKLNNVQARRSLANQQNQFKEIRVNQLRRQSFEPRGWGK